MTDKEKSLFYDLLTIYYDNIESDIQKAEQNGDDTSGLDASSRKDHQMTELEHLDQLDHKLQAIFDLAVEARDEAQAAIVAIGAVKNDLLSRKIELQRVELREREAGK